VSLIKYEKKIKEDFNVVLCFICYFLLTAIWVLPGTIGIRHWLLGIGFLSAIFYIWSNRSFLIINQTCMPLMFIGTLFLWVGVHYLFFSLNSVLELREIKGIWLRSLGGIVIAIMVGIAFHKFKNVRAIFLLSLVLVPLINLAIYAYQSKLKEKILHPNEFVTQYLFNKIETVFFGTVAVSVLLAYAFVTLSKKQNLITATKLFAIYVSCMLIALSSVISSSKNGVAMSLGLFFLYFMSMTYLSIFRSGQRIKYFISALIFALVFLFIKNFHQENSYPGWKTFGADIKVAVQIEKYQHWRNPNRFGYPLNEYAQEVAFNTYERAAWAVAGVHLLSNNPLGYGSVNNSFKGMLNHQGIEHNVPGQTHSGWIDFALGFGIPGILIIILAQLSIIYLGLKSKTRFGLIGVWICIALLPLGVIAEISYKQYFEATLFFITFAATMVWNTQSGKA
jgi:O-Antigen ligase